MILWFHRSIFCLPHPSIIARWTSSVEAEPGFLKIVFDVLQSFRDEDKDVNLVFDSMAIRKQIIRDPKTSNFIGYTDYGGIHVEHAETPASEVLVFMLVCLNGKWRLPVAYFFQDKCPASVQGELVKTALTLCNDAGLRVHSLTCDGAATNFATLKYLGCNIYSKEDNHTFKYPDKDDVVCVIPDACHMVKLARNALGIYPFYYLCFPSYFHSIDLPLFWSRV